jgi:hypothetical protein
VSDINVYTAFQLEEFFNGQNTLLFAEYVTYAPVKLEMARNDHNQARYKHQLGIVLRLFITVAQVIDPCMFPIGSPHISRLMLDTNISSSSRTNVNVARM